MLISLPRGLGLDHPPLGADVPEKILLTPAGLQAFLKAEIDRWTPVIKKAGATMPQ